MVDESRINNTLGKFDYHMKNHESICVSVSGGSDSNIILHIIATYFRQYLPKTHFLFCDTGIEYEATKRHIEYMQDKYHVKIDTEKGVPIPLVIKQYGVPVLSKRFSQIANAYCRDIPYAVDRVKNADKMYGKAHLTDTEVALCEAIKNRGILVSDKCCKLSKKDPATKYRKNIAADLHITGERLAEGGVRAAANDSCFKKDVHGSDHFMPLFFWDDDTKDYYKREEGIIYSDCYEIWGMKRTGCVGCPFNSRIAIDLEMIKKYEPKMYDYCLAIFGHSYRLMDEFCVRRKNKILTTTQPNL